MKHAHRVVGKLGVGKLGVGKLGSVKIDEKTTCGAIHPRDKAKPLTSGRGRNGLL